VGTSWLLPKFAREIVLLPFNLPLWIYHTNSISFFSSKETVGVSYDSLENGFGKRISIGCFSFGGVSKHFKFVCLGWIVSIGVVGRSVKIVTLVILRDVFALRVVV
jgi:hypothetical protein